MSMPMQLEQVNSGRVTVRAASLGLSKRQGFEERAPE